MSTTRMQVSRAAIHAIRSLPDGQRQAAVSYLLAQARRENFFRTGLSEKQRGFLSDKAKNKLLRCGRRAGKTEALAARHAKLALAHPGQMSLYIILQANQARGIFFRKLQRVARDLGLDLEREERDGKLFARWPNGHLTWLAGCSNKAACEKFRGFDFVGVSIDEAGSLDRWLRYLVEDVLEPLLADHDGDVVLAGTPNPTTGGYFYGCSTGKIPGVQQWSEHHWTMFENPWMRHAHAFAERILARNGWSEQHPSYRREYLGEWVEDASGLALPFGERNWRSLGDGSWEYVLGVDLGASAVERSTAFVLLAYRAKHPGVHIVEARKYAAETPSSIAERVQQYRERFPKLLRVVIDPGAHGQGYIREFQERHGIFCEPAPKKDKSAYVQFLRADIEAALVTLDPQVCVDLVEEGFGATVTEWLEKTAVDHLCDALLYGWRVIRTALQEPVPEPEPGSDEYVRRMTDKWKDAEIKRVRLARKSARVRWAQ